MLVSATEMLQRAAQGKYAVGQFNINNLEWIKALLEAGERTSSPMILGVTEAACRYMGGLRTVRGMVEGMLAHMNVNIPVALHLDHAGKDFCLQAIGAGFSSVMFDGSKKPFAENLACCRELGKICAEHGISLEAELGSPAGEEDGISGCGDKALPEECARLAQSGITMLAASIGNMHGEYPHDWPGLDLNLLAEIHEAVGGMPLVLHGGSGIPDEMMRKAIGLGICKINVNTECQIAFAKATGEYFAKGLDKREKGYSLQKMLDPGIVAIIAKTIEKIEFFGSKGKSLTMTRQFT